VNENFYLGSNLNQVEGLSGFNPDPDKVYYYESTAKNFKPVSDDNLYYLVNTLNNTGTTTGTTIVVAGDDTAVNGSNYYLVNTNSNTTAVLQGDGTAVTTSNYYVVNTSTGTAVYKGDGTKQDATATVTGHSGQNTSRAYYAFLSSSSSRSWYKSDGNYLDNDYYHSTNILGDENNYSTRTTNGTGFYKYTDTNDTVNGEGSFDNNTVYHSIGNKGNHAGMDQTIKKNHSPLADTLEMLGIMGVLGVWVASAVGGFMLGKRMPKQAVEKKKNKSLKSVT
jgi:hypothetical protein